MMGRSRGKLITLLLSFFVLGTIFGWILFGWISHRALMGGPEASWGGRRAEATAQIVAVKPNMGGVVLSLGVTLEPGKGRIWEDTHQLKGFDFQASHHIAVQVVSELYDEVSLDDDGVGLAGADVLFEVFPLPQEEIEISAVDGPSAGSAAALALMAAIENKSVRTDVAITGTIRKDGTIGIVGGLYIIKDREGNLHILGKPAAAHKAGIKTLFVPKGQRVEYYEPFGWWWTSHYVEISRLQKVIHQKGWKLEIREVPTISEASEYMLQSRF